MPAASAPAEADSEVRHRFWYSRGYLPHYDGVGTTQFITFRLHDSLPDRLLRTLQHELSHLPEVERNKEERSRIMRLVDQGHGACWLSRPEIAQIVEGSLLYFHGDRYELESWVVMPNHVHLLARFNDQSLLDKVVHSWKSYSARQANQILGRTGPFWYRDYYDRFIRDGEHYANVVRYIENNPVKARLAQCPEAYAFGSARLRLEQRRQDAGGPS